jgi:TonB family protein
MMVTGAMFLLAVSVVATLGALLVETGLRRMGVATRFAWLAALALGPVLLAVRSLSLLGRSAPVEAPSWVPVVELPPLVLAPPGPASGGLGWEETAALVWLASALGLAALVVLTHRRLLRERESWESTRVLGRDVFVSTDRGPAVAGMWRPWIVLPRWVLSLPEAELRMVVLHEEEHMRARDTLLLGAGLGLVALSAWSPVTWWQLRRLRAAMEVDCDRRVLREAPDRAVYGASLLTVAARAAGPSLGLAAFTERSLNLKRRILAMTAKTSRMTAVGGGILVVLGLVVGVQACGVESPMGLQPTAEALPVQAPSPRTATEPEPTGSLPDGGRVFTPFTQAPRVLNGDRIVEALRSQYPPLLADAGVTGTAEVFMFVDTTGAVQDVRINRSSGHMALDDAALKVAGLFRFDPARHQDQKVEAWVSFPIPFGPAANPASQQDLEAGPRPTPFTNAPVLLNREELVAVMNREYPPLLRGAGIGGTARLYFLIGADGRVVKSVIDQSSGHPALDEAALRVARQHRFAPAKLRDEPVPVWLSLPVTFREKPPEPQAAASPIDPNGDPTFTPFTVAPSIVNRDEVIAAMVREYPPELRAAKVGGTVRVYFFIDAEGKVGRTLIDRSSGQPEIDDAALRVAGEYRFTPALNRDEKVPVWVSFPITFSAR